MTSSTAPANDANWDKIAFYLDHALSLFGSPASLAKRIWLTVRDHKLFSNYIRPLEELVRRLVFIAALELAPMTLPATPERKFRARLAMPANAGATFESTKPETWRVSFRLEAQNAGAPAGTTTPPANNAGAGAPDRIPSAPSAERLEALLRAYETRDQLAAALARKIARNARVALTYIVRPRRKLAHKTVWIAVCEFADLAAEAHQRFIHRKLDALRPDSS